MSSKKRAKLVYEIRLLCCANSDKREELPIEKKCKVLVQRLYTFDLSFILSELFLYLINISQVYTQTIKQCL